MGCSSMGGTKKAPFLKSVTHILQWWNLAQLYLTQRRSKKYMNHVTHPLSSADISIFSPEISKFCYIKKYRYRLHFDIISNSFLTLTYLESLKIVLINMVTILMMSAKMGTLGRTLGFLKIKFWNKYFKINYFKYFKINVISS